MHSVVARDYLSYTLSELDAALSDDKPHEPLSRLWACAVLRAAAELPEFPRFLDPASELCFAARLLKNGGTPASRQQLLQSLLNADANPSAHTVLVRRQIRQLTIDEADQLPDRERRSLIAIEHTEMLCDPDMTDRTFGNAAVVVRFPEGAVLRLAVVDPTTVNLVFHEHAGAKATTKLLVRPLAPELVRDLQERIARRSKSLIFQPYSRQPASQNAVPDALVSRLARMLQEHLRLTVLVTAAAPSGQARTLAFDRAYVQSDRLMHFHLPLHPSSCACICPAHGMLRSRTGKTTVALSLCGSAFGEGVLCPQCKEEGGGEQRICTRHFSIELRCTHRNGEDWAVPFRLPLHQGLSTAARIEFLHVLALVAAYFQSKKPVTPARVGALDMQLLRVRVAPSSGANDEDALALLEEGSLFQDKPGVLKSTTQRPLNTAEKRVRETHAHLFPRKARKTATPPPLPPATPPPRPTPAGRGSSSASASGSGPPPRPAPRPAPPPPPAPAPPPPPPDAKNTLDEFIDVEGLQEALRQLGGILETATGRAQLRAQSFVQFLKQLEEACQQDGELEMDGPCGYVCYKLPVVYEQKRGYGRLNTANERRFEDFYKNEVRVLCLQGAPRLLRPFLCGRFCRDFDMQNAQPTILLQLAKRIRNGIHQMPMLQQWVDDRPGFIAHVAEVHDITEDVKDTVKQLVISLIFGGEYEHWMNKRRLPLDVRSPWITRLARELADLRTSVFNHDLFKGHVQRERDRHAKEGRKNPAAADRSIFAVLAQHQENEILTVVREGVAAQGFDVESLQFDGLFLLERPDGKRLNLKPIEDDILKKRGYEITMVEKELLFQGPWPTLQLDEGSSTAARNGKARVTATATATPGGLGPLMDPAVLAGVDAADADAVHRAILAGLDETVLAGGFVLLQDGGVWLARQTMPNGPPALGDLGGKKDAGETLWQAAVREVLEEGGLDFSACRLASTDQIFYSCKRTGERSYVFFIVETQEAPRRTGDKRIVEHCHFKALPEWSALHPRMQFATGLRTRLQQCLQ